MDTIETMFVYLFFAMLLGVITGAIAQKKGESFFGWWLFGTFLFIVALPLVLIMPVNQKALGAQTNCLYCGASIQFGAGQCKECGRAQPTKFWSGKSSTKSWEKTVAAEDDVSKWAKQNEKKD